MVISPLFVRLLWVLLWNATAIKCAIGSALVVAPLWAFLVKPLLRRRRASAPPAAEPFMDSVDQQAAKPSPRRRRGEAKAKEGEKKQEKERANGTAVPEALSPVPHPPRAPAPAVHDALEDLFHSEAFACWYRANRGPLQDRVWLRSAQKIWASLAVVALLLLGACVLPLFSFTSGDATLVAMLRARCERSGNSGSVAAPWDRALGYAETLVILTAGLTLVTSAFMPQAAKGTASTALAAFSVLIAEAAAVQRMGVGAGFTVLIGVVMWRVASACG